MHIFYHPNSQLYTYLDVLQELKGHKLFWTHEDPYESDLTFDMLPHFYYIFTSDENTARELKKEGKANYIEYVPHACNPAVHKPQEVPFEYRSDITFIGNAYESRLQWFQDHADQYKDKLVTLIGVGYRGLDGYRNQRVFHGHVSEAEMDKYINGAKLVLNLHRQNSDLDMANKRNIQPSSFNNRYYEVWGCGKKQLVIGRGQEFTWDEDYKSAHELHSYKKRLTDHYLPLLQGIGK